MMSCRNKFVFIMGLFCLGIVSCASPKRIIEKGDLCGVVVDENNLPISNFIVNCTDNGFYNETVITNNSGIFVFQNVNTGTYYLQGEKENYSKLNKKEFNFNDNASIFCCQISSLDDVVNRANSLIECKQFQKAVELMENVLTKNKTRSEAVVLAYKTYLYMKLQKDFSYKINLEKLKNYKNNNSLELVKLMENKKNEKKIQ